MLEDMSNSPSTSRRRPKPSQENWDDDFEFALPTKKQSSTSTNASKPSSSHAKGKGKDENIPITRNESPVEDWDENWDESPPRSVPKTTTVTVAKHERKKLSIPPPINIPSSSSSSSARINPPRLSPSHSAGFSISPLPTSFSSSPQQPLLPSRSHSSIGLDDPQHVTARARSGSTTAGTVSRNKLVKRHPSTSFVPVSSNSSSTVALNTTFSDPSEASLASISMINRSSPNLPRGSPSIPRSTSGEQMPPPPLPQGGILGRARSRSRSKVRPDSRQDIRISSIPFSPSRDDLKDKEKEKKPGFWKRLSGVPAGERNEGTPQHRRRRSSSVGAKHLPSGSPRPPVPPLPMNLRSPSGSSNTSTSSAKSGPASAFSALLRRSSSSLSKRSDKSKETPPSSYPYFSAKNGVSSSSVNSFVQQPVIIPNRPGDVTPDLPSSSSFSRGFHLPSPSPGSPYHAPKSRIPSAAPGYADLPPLPHSSSFPGPRAQGGSGSDTETEGEGKTPRRRKKIRPVSALPAPKTTSGFNGDNWRGMVNDGPQHQIPGLPISRQSSFEFNSAKSSNSPSGFASSTTSTLKRLGSLSKKQGRRLSGGWKFGTNSSSDSNRSANRPLEPVLGSPSKPYKNSEGEIPLSPISPTPDMDNWTEEDMRKAIRAGSVSAPTSMFKPPPTQGSNTGASANANDYDEAGLSKDTEKKEKHRRRQSWNDFIIPREVMMKQKELKEGIGAVKMFAGGVATLKTLLSTHANIRDRILASGTPNDAANFASLDSEFEQWLEMAVVLVEVGSTGADPSTQPSFSSPPRSRRVTLASDEAKAASAAMSKAMSAPANGLPKPPVQLASWRKASLPDPEETNFSSMVGPPRADYPYPEQWRASTGRQDLSKRQLEVLRTMLRTPMSSIPDGGRPGMGIRTSSTLSAASVNSANNGYLHAQNQGSPSPNSRIQSRRISRGLTLTPDESISFPSPNDSAYIQPSNSFPSPISAAKMDQPTQPQKTLKDRRASKAGLAGLKEFLRSLKKDNRLPSSSAAGVGGGGGLSPLRIRGKFGIKNSTSPPASPTSPITSYFSKNNNTQNDVFYPTQRSSFSALGSASASGSGSGNVPQTPQTAPLLQTQFVSTTTKSSKSRSRSGTQVESSATSSPRLALGNEQKRPSIRNIFRTSSGNWSDLVKNDQSTATSTANSSFTSSPSSSLNSYSNSTKTNGSPSSISGLSKKLSSQKLGLGFSLKPSTSSSTISGIGTGNKISVSDPIPSKIPLSSSSRTISATNDYGPPASLSINGDRENEMTLRPNNTARKRVSGLGLGLGWPETGPGVGGSPVKLSGGSSSTNASGISEMGIVYESPSKMDRNDQTMKPPSRYGYGYDHNDTGNEEIKLLPNSPSKIGFPSNSTSNNISGNSSRLPSYGSSLNQGDTSMNGIRSSEDSITGNEIDGKDLTIALTPENLPTLLEYLRQCERMLSHWRERVEEIIELGKEDRV